MGGKVRGESVFKINCYFNDMPHLAAGLGASKIGVRFRLRRYQDGQAQMRLGSLLL